MNILLTNDDSHDSPLFLLAIDMLKGYGTTTIVVPAREQSWKGKSMTRFGSLYVDTIDLHGTPAFSVTGTPADCVNLAIYNLMDTRPDVVVSGINLGINAGLGFLMASGTIGACFEANVAGIPGLAISQQLSPDEHREWADRRHFSDASLSVLEGVVKRVMPTVWQRFVTDQPPHSTTWTVNLPSELRDDEIVRTRLGRSFYNRCFSARGGTEYFHDLAPFAVDPAPDTDEAVVRSGRVSVSRIDLTVLGQDV